MYNTAIDITVITVHSKNKTFVIKVNEKYVRLVIETLFDCLLHSTIYNEHL